ncbi:MAG: ARMT1-like domain-containing protein [Deltaproteobacteria bacterium]|nr:ARMT1-like domain-containing protein [Deltaproteobacteria bacterium]
MRTYPECISCFLNQALRAGRAATTDEMKLKKLLAETTMLLKSIPPDTTPPEIGMSVYRKVREFTGVIDPYKDIKRDSTRQALRLYPYLKSKVDASGDRLLTAIRIAIAGNIIDRGIDKDYNLKEEIDDTLQKDFALSDYDKFRRRLTKMENILYIGDNAGETVFDKILIEELKKKVLYTVRETPVINDATYEDAVEAGIDTVAGIVSSGTSAPGTILKTCNDTFRYLYKNSDFIISKGQGNYEALSHEDRPIFFLLKVKCMVIARDIGVGTGDIVLKGINV